jgi:hypothetical protein
MTLFRAQVLSTIGLGSPPRLAARPHDRKLFDRPAVEDATLSPSMKLRLWTSRPL